MKIKFLSVVLVVILSSAFAYAHEEKNLNETKKLIDSGIGCDKLTENQLEKIGEYYMEQMHPGEAHEMMHKMMGMEEGSDAEEQMHVNMAEKIYCNKSVDMSGGTMGMMGHNMDNSIMGHSSPSGNLTSSLTFNILIIALIILVVLAIIKLSKGLIKK